MEKSILQKASIALLCFFFVATKAMGGQDYTLKFFTGQSEEANFNFADNNLPAWKVESGDNRTKTLTATYDPNTGAIRASYSSIITEIQKNIGIGEDNTESVTNGFGPMRLYSRWIINKKGDANVANKFPSLNATFTTAYPDPNNAKKAMTVRDKENNFYGEVLASRWESDRINEQQFSTMTISLSDDIKNDVENNPGNYEIICLLTYGGYNYKDSYGSFTHSTDQHNNSSVDSKCSHLGFTYTDDDRIIYERDILYIVKFDLKKTEEPIIATLPPGSHRIKFIKLGDQIGAGSDRFNIPDGQIKVSTENWHIPEASKIQTLSAKYYTGSNTINVDFSSDWTNIRRNMAISGDNTDQNCNILRTYTRWIIRKKNLEEQPYNEKKEDYRSLKATIEVPTSDERVHNVDVYGEDEQYYGKSIFVKWAQYADGNDALAKATFSNLPEDVMANPDAYEVVCLITYGGCRYNEENDGAKYQPGQDSGNNNWGFYYEEWASRFKVPENFVMEFPVRYMLKFNLVEAIDPTTPSADNANFLHYVGYYQEKYVNPNAWEWEVRNGHKMQKVHSWTYKKYMRPEAGRRELQLPVEIHDNKRTYGDGVEPRHYFRWYNYETDASAGELSIDPNGNPKNGTMLGNGWDGVSNIGLVNTKSAPPSDSSKGEGGPNYENVAEVWFDPSGLDNKGVVKIACDVSRYKDGHIINDKINDKYQEPTLSMRYIYEVYPAHVIADELKAAILKGNGNVYENQGWVSFGLKNGNGEANLRLNLQYTKDYFFYNYNGGLAGKDHQVTENEFGNDLCQATNVFWRVFDSTGEFYKDFDGNPKYNGKTFPLTLNHISRDDYRSLDNSQTKRITFNEGDIAYVVAFVKDDNGHSCPVSRFSCRFLKDSYPMSSDQIRDNNAYQYRKVDYLEKYYDRVAVISFDQEGELGKPTNRLDNMGHKPLNWEDAAYGFVYKDLFISNGNSDWFGDNIAGLSPNHGDYGFYKSANVANVSPNGFNNYQWWFTNDESQKGKSMYDRTYYMTNGAQSGYFLYVDASNEARPIARAWFDGKLCEGSTVVASMTVADLTDHGDRKDSNNKNTNVDPQLMFHLYGIDRETGETRRIHSFATCDFYSLGIDGYTQATWYQVYAKITMQKGTGVEQCDKFYITIDNYANSTRGADYAVDDIRIYTRTAKVQVAQQAPACETTTEGGEIKTSPANFTFKVLHESLLSSFGTDKTKFSDWPIFYRICKEGSEEPIKGIYGGNADDEYGKFTFHRNPYTDDSKTTLREGYEEIGPDVYAVFNKDLDLSRIDENGKPCRYYISLCEPYMEGDNLTDRPDGTWGVISNSCSFYSDPFEIISSGAELTVTVDNKTIDYLPVPCNTTAGAAEAKFNVTMHLLDPVHGGTIEVCDIKWKWEIQKMDGTILQQFNDFSENITYNYNFADAQNGIKVVLTEPNLQKKDGRYYYHVDGIGDIVLCDMKPVQIFVGKNAGAPELYLGFKDIDYKDKAASRIIRLGLGQLNEMRGGTTKLIMPVLSFENSKAYGETTDFRLKTDGDYAKLLVINSDDDNFKGKSYQVGTIDALDAEKLVVNLQPGSEVPAFREGYQYELAFEVYDSKDENTQKCTSYVPFILKVVPEYVVWTPAGSNTNWNNDANWKRATAEQLYKTDEGSGAYDNTYQEAGRYVPMFFTKVILPAGSDVANSPLLNQLEKASNGVLTGESLSNGSSFATTDIQYDMMVEETTGDHTVAGTSYHGYYCEKFDGNLCDQVFFKPQGELRNQQYLTYHKAWVEYQLESNKWYMLSTPLKYTYAGDMYVPTSGQENKVDAFDNVTFYGNDYSRTGYPVYQRSWDKTERKVYRAEADSYDADIDYDWQSPITDDNINVIANNWSHTYNDVTERYDSPVTNGVAAGHNGFSIKMNKVNKEEKALLRLPKADMGYTYYNYNNGNTGHSVDLSRGSGTDDNQYRLMTLQSDGSYKMKLAQDKGSGYYIVSNPLMANIDMNSFFNANLNLEPKFWLVEGGEAHAKTAKGEKFTIAPTQSFMVKKADGATSDEVVFSTNMTAVAPVSLETGQYVASRMAIKTYSTPRAEQPKMTMTASYEGRKSSATMALKAESDVDFVEREDVETIYDSNLSDVPTLYTVAGNQAVSVNTLPEIDIVPMGIVCSENIDAKVTVKGVKTMGELYLLDRKQNTATPVTEGGELTIRANDHGRYFLSTRSTTGIKRPTAEEDGIQVYSPAPGMLTVTCLAADNELEQVDVYTIDGTKVTSSTDLHESAVTLSVPRGVMVVTVKGKGIKNAKHHKVLIQ